MSQTASRVELVSISQDHAGQRLDNFLLNRLKGVPKSHIYRLLRSGQVRVNKGRKKAHYRLSAGDEVRIPPVRVGDKQAVSVPPRVVEQLEASILLENDDILVVDKPSGIAVHGGSGVPWGVIEALRASRPDDTLELVHRLDRDTSGCLLLAKSRRSLKLCHEAFRNEHHIEKVYTALVKEHWPGTVTVDAAIGRVVRSGERMMQIDDEGQHAVSHFECLKLFDSPVPATLVSVRIETGRTHQIRVHASSSGHPLAGDNKYGDDEFDAALKAAGLDRLFLHAASLRLQLPQIGDIAVSAPLPQALQRVLEQLS